MNAVRAQKPTKLLFGLGLWLVALAVMGGCDWRRIVLESELAPGVRAEIVRECCDCLAFRSVRLEEDACGSEPSSSDAGVPWSRCLCGMETDACADALLSGAVIELVGACTAASGPCATECEGVLAYPP